jgi:predicted nucleic acid-binding protein
MAHYLLDTCILVDYFRGNEKAAQFLEEFESPPFLSALTVVELYAGVREGKERALLDKLIQYFPIIPLDNEAAIKGGLYRRQYGESHGVGIVDALLASSAEGKNLILATCNVKHFPMIKNVHCPY